MADLLRLYTLDECGKDGYPPEWHRVDVGSHAYASPGERWAPGIKEIVRLDAGHRCIRCLHPYRKGEHGNGEWSRCDEQCLHDGPAEIFAGGNCIGGPDLTNAEIKRALAMGSGVDAQWRILTVHHLDGVKANCRWWNLAVLCQRCHLQIQGKVQMARVWPWEHTDWFKPYVAGYYASVYLVEELTRDEVDERLDELLALERIA